MIEIFSSQIKLKKNCFKIKKLNGLKMQNMTQCDALITKNYILAFKKYFFNMEIFTSEIMMKKNFFKIGKQNWLKMKTITHRDALNTKNYILAHQEIYFEDRNFFFRYRGEKKILKNWKIEFAKNTEYDSA